MVDVQSNCLNASNLGSTHTGINNTRCYGNKYDPLSDASMLSCGNQALRNSSTNPMKQLCDSLGVTDRYTGYRHNLNRSQLNPSNVGFAWMDNTQPNAYNRSLNVGWTGHRSQSAPANFGISGSRLYTPTAPQSAPPHQRTGYVNPKQTTGTTQSLHVKHSGVEFHTGPMTKSIQEQCGINTVFPGRTEYMDRYPKPELNTKTSPFIVNPTPNFKIHGRPLAKQGYIPKITEYQGRYVWPDGSKITKLPWLQK